MRTVKGLHILFLAFMLSSCDFSCSVGDHKSKIKTRPVSSKDNTALNGAIIKNDIDLDARGVKLREAYLLNANRELITENEAAIGERIYLVLVLDTGWVKENGRSFIGASEKILTRAGRVVVGADDIFKAYETEGLDADDAGVISLSAVITEAYPGVNDFTVKFRVWDKKGSGEVEGKYKFNLKE